MGLLGCTNRCCVHRTHLSIPCYSTRSALFPTPSCGHFLILIHISHFIMRPCFVRTCCMTKREDGGREWGQRWENDWAYMRNGHSQFPIAVKHLARVLNNQTFRAWYVFLYYKKLGLKPVHQLLGAQTFKIQATAKRALCARKNVIQQLRCVFPCVSFVQIHA